MAEKKYIDISPFIRDLTAMKREYTAISLDGIIKALKEAPAADVVSRSAYDQIRWERNIAMQQLDEAGIPFGGKSDKEYAPVVHAEWEFRNNGSYGQTICYCSACGKHSGFFGSLENQMKPYCSNCGARMDGGKHG